MFINKLSNKLFAVCICVLMLLSLPALAGSQQKQALQHAPEDIVSFAKGLEFYAASQGARAFIISRVGRPSKDLPKDIHYTHTAIAIYSNITLDSGEVVQGYAVHNLYQNAENLDRSSLVVDYPVDFFWGAHELKAGIIIPKHNIQQALIELVNSGNDAKLHNPKYSVLASPFNNMYQNCTEHTLNLLNAAIYNTLDIAQLKANTNAHFSAQRVHTSRFKLMLGATFHEGITTRDHKGKVKTTTFTSIAKYLHQYDLSIASVTFTEDLQAQTIHL